MYSEIGSHETAKASRFFLNPVGFNVDSPMPWTAFPHGGLSLRECLQRGRLDDVAAMAVTAQLVMAVGHLHRMGICHLDIKASNVLWSLDDSALKLVDMGMAERIPVTNPRFEVYVSEPYRPPEVWAAASRHMMLVALTPAVDVWSVGCLVFEVVSGKCLMEAIKRTSIRAAVQLWCAAHARSDQQQLVSVQLARVHARWQRFVACCCAPAPESRLQFAQVLDQGLTWLRDRLAAHPNRDPFQITAPSSNQQALPRHR
jgi:serine/threonine protein kinase